MKRKMILGMLLMIGALTWGACGKQDTNADSGESKVSTEAQAQEDTQEETSTTEAAACDIEIAVLPLVKTLNDKSQEIYQKLSENWKCVLDSSGNIGNRYTRYDEKGVPFCVVVDFETEDTNLVTVRISETEELVQINIDELEDYFEERLSQE